MKNLLLTFSFFGAAATAAFGLEFNVVNTTDTELGLTQTIVSSSAGTQVSEAYFQIGYLNDSAGSLLERFTAVGTTSQWKTGGSPTTALGAGGALDLATYTVDDVSAFVSKPVVGMIWTPKSSTDLSLVAAGEFATFTFKLQTETLTWTGVNESTVFTLLKDDTEENEFVKIFDMLAGTFEGGALTLAAIPEPSMFGLLAGLGALALAGTRRRRK